MNMDIYVTSASYTRPADTAAYTANDAISNSTTTPSVLTFSNAAGKEGRGGVLEAVRIKTSAYTASGTPGALAGELWLFHTAPTALEDNAAVDLSDAEVGNAIGWVAFDFDTDGAPGTATAGAGGNMLAYVDTIELPYKCAAGSVDLYGVLIARNDYVPVSAEVFTIDLIVNREFS